MLVVSRDSAARYLAVAAVGSLVLLSGCGERAAIRFHALTGAYSGSTDPLVIPANAQPSDYKPRNPLVPLVDGILGQPLPIRGGGGLQVEQWMWVVGPSMRTAGISFAHAVLVEVIGGSGTVRLSGPGQQSEVRVNAGDAFIIAPSQTAAFDNAGAMQIDMRATYLIDPALNP